MFTLLKHWPESMSHVLKHTSSRSYLQVKDLSLNFVSTPYFQDGLKDFYKTCVRCSPHQGDVQNQCLNHTNKLITDFGLPSELCSWATIKVLLSFYFRLMQNNVTPSVQLSVIILNLSRYYVMRNHVGLDIDRVCVAL